MIKIVFEKENNRSVAIHNNIEVGECTFVEEGEIWNINHTGVNETYRGQGVARKLVEAIIENSKVYNKKLIADCSYAKRLI